MAKSIIEMHATTVAYSANQNFTLALGPKPYTITRIGLILQLTVSTGATPGTVNDPWDRVIANLSLGSGGYNYFSFQDMRLARHVGRFLGYQIGAPAGLAASVSNQTVTFGYNIHFGVSPLRVDLSKGVPVDNPFDLTAGIPAYDQTLMLTGQWGAATAPGSGYTISSGTLYVVLFGVQPDDPSEPATNYMPLARPRFFTELIQESATTGVFARTYNVPVGDFLHSTMLMTTAGSPDARSNSVLNSLKVRANNPAIDFVTALNDDVVNIVSQLIQLGEDGWPPADNPASPGSFLIGQPSDPGIYFYYWPAFARKGHPLFGFDLRQAQLSQLQIAYGVGAAGNIYVLHRKYQLLS